jgi:hypothetical protein
VNLSKTSKPDYQRQILHRFRRPLQFSIRQTVSDLFTLIAA